MLIHAVFVPTILLSSDAILANVPVVPNLPPATAAYLNLGVLNSLFYGTFYTLLDPQFGAPALAVLFAVTLVQAHVVWLGTLPDFVPAAATKALHALLPEVLFAHPTRVAVILFLVGWIVQFIGHGVFERRAPALLDNLLQALVLAPFFVCFEVAHALGFRKEIMDRVDAKILPEIRAFHKVKE